MSHSETRNSEHVFFTEVRPHSFFVRSQTDLKTKLTLRLLISECCSLRHFRF